MHWQELITNLIIAAAGAYLVWRATHFFRAKSSCGCGPKGCGGSAEQTGDASSSVVFIPTEELKLRPRRSASAGDSATS